MGHAHARSSASAFQSLDAPDKKPLYLCTDTPVTVEAAQHSLVVRRSGHAPQRLPLTRIDRIVCRGNIQWSAAAISHCCRAGVAVIWLDGRGECIGSTLPYQPPCSAFDTLLERYAALPEWSERFEIWLSRRRLETLTDWALRADRAGHPPEHHAFQRIKREFVHQGHHPQGFSSQGKGWCQALVVSRLHSDGLRTRYWGYRGSTLALADVIAGLLWAELNLDAGGLSAAATEGAVAARLFQAWAHERTFRIHHHLADLQRHVANECEQWP